MNQNKNARTVKIRTVRMKKKDSKRNMASIQTDHSTSDQECHSRELLNAEVPVMLVFSDGETTPQHSNGTSMVFLRLLDLNNGKETH
jgi:hypothetical protein